MLKKSWAPEAGIGLGIGLSLMVVGRDRMFRDPGTFWHVVVGRRILGGSGFPEVDPFSHTHRGRPWIAQQWLGECSMALVHDRLGLDGLLLGSAAILGLLFGWLAHRLLRAGLLGLPTTALIVLGVSASSVHFHARPMLASILGFGLTCAWLGDVESGRRSLRSLGWLVPAFLIWSNVHGGMMAGWATLAFVVGGWILMRLAGRESPVDRLGTGVRLGLLVVACGLTALVNPYGLRLPRTWVEIMASPVIPRLIVEHAPPRLDDPSTLTVGVLALAFGVALLGVPIQDWRVTWMVAPIWLVLSLGRVRNVPLFAVAALAAMADILPHSRVGEWLARPGRDLFLPVPEGTARGLGRWWLVPAGVVVLVLGLQIAGVRAPVVGRGWARFDPSYWPMDLLPEIRRASESQPRPRIFNEDFLGGFLIYHVPDLPVFMDDRYELYGDDWLDRYDRAERDPEALMRWLAESGVDLALVRTGLGFDRAFHDRDGWSVVKETDLATLYRKDGAGSSIGRGLAP